MTNNLNLSNTYKQFLAVQSQSVGAQCSDMSVSLQNDAPSIAAVKICDTPEEKKGHALTKAVATVAIAGAIVGLFFAKGLSSKFYKNIDSYIQKIDDKIYEYTNKHKTLSVLQYVYLKFNEGVRSFLEWCKIGNNITAARDAGFMGLCDKIGLGKPMRWITKQFKKLTVATSKTSYEKARNVADSNIAYLRGFIPELKKINPEKAGELESLLSKLEGEISNITNATSRAERLSKIEAATKDIGAKVGKDFNILLHRPKKRNWEKMLLYRTEVHSAKGRERLLNELKSAQRGFTFNIDDQTKIMNELANEIGRVLNPKDAESRNILRQLRKQIKQYSSLAGETEIQARNNLISSMNICLEDLSANIARAKYSEESQYLFNEKLSEIKEILTHSSDKGTIEDILGILNSSFKTQNPKLYNQAKSLTDEIRSVTNKAFENELKLYDKFAEYSVGSAPTDVLGMVLPAGLAGYAISKGDDKDARISATLKSGIPILGGVATTFIAAAKMMTNIQGILLGAVATVVLNAIGSKADEAYKEYKERSLFAQKAIAAYKKNNVA